MRRIAIFTMLLCLLASAGGSVHVVTSFFPVHCWTVNVAGSNAHVESLLPPGGEPHDYAFKVSDARKLARADLVVVNGLGLEVWLPRFLRSAKPKTNRIVFATAGIDAPLIFGEHHHHHSHHGGHDAFEHEGEQPNEHTWLDPVLAVTGVSNILQALQRADPPKSAAYASNAQAYVTRLHKLDIDLRQMLSHVTNRAIVTYHDAFPYFARRYGLEVAGVVETVPEVNPTPKYLSRLGRVMRERELRVIFVEPGGKTRVAQRIAQDLRVDLAELDTLESGPLTPAAYEERMRQNAAVLQKYLK
jgi:zinc/manganese transport system substrate-binding protein